MMSGRGSVNREETTGTGIDESVVMAASTTGGREIPEGKLLKDTIMEVENQHLR
jgi:hypothetical protein